MVSAAYWFLAWFRVLGFVAAAVSRRRSSPYLVSRLGLGFMGWGKRIRMQWSRKLWEEEDVDLGTLVARRGRRSWWELWWREEDEDDLCLQAREIFFFFYCCWNRWALGSSSATGLSLVQREARTRVRLLDSIIELREFFFLRSNKNL